MLSKVLLGLLVCPKCKGEVAYRRGENAIDCPACKLRYRVEDDIPVMLMNEAKRIPKAKRGR